MTSHRMAATMTLLLVVMMTSIMAVAGVTPNQHDCEEDIGFKYDKIRHHNTDKRASPRVANLRLPTSLKPVHYILQLQPFINGNFSIAGFVQIEILVLQPTTNVTLHIEDIITKNETITLVASDNLAGPGVAITQHLYDYDRQFYIALLGEELVVGKTYVLSMEFTGLLSNHLYGFYRSDYIEVDGDVRLLGVSDFEPTNARVAFPCFDEPAMKATFDISLAREVNMTSISNMPLIETIPFNNQSSWVWDHYATTLPMSTYLVAFVVSEFTHIDSNENDHVLFRIWARKSFVAQSEYALSMGPKVLTFYEQYFNIPFPLPKQDMIAIPDFSAGAMENWGLVTYRETYLLYDPVLSKASERQGVVAVIAHELAHMWFGDLVTMKWWDDIWLNEGFASFMEYFGTDGAEPGLRYSEQFLYNEFQYVFTIDCFETSRPISIPVEDPNEIGAMFDSITYSKGASIIRMMHYFLTESTFKKGITNYLTNKTLSNADKDDLWAFLTASAHEDGTLPAEVTVKTIMDTWTLQMGYPVITVSRSLDGTSATVSQERFLLRSNPNSTDTRDYKWWVPVTYASQSSPDFTKTKPSVWIQETPNIAITGLPSSSEWVIFNLQESSYYRVNYDDNNWNLIIQQLKTDHTIVNLLNRAQLVDDTLQLALAGQLSYTTALGINNYLNKETEYLPFKCAFASLAYLDDMFVQTGGYGQLKRYFLASIVPLYNSVGFVDSLSDPHLKQYTRVFALSWACDLGVADCLDNSYALYQKWMLNASDPSIISPNVKSTVICTGIAEGGEVEWNFSFNQYQLALRETQKRIFISGLGCTKEIWILTRYLDLAFTANSGIRKQDASRAFSAVAHNTVGQYIAWNYLRNQWQSIAAYYGYFGIISDLTNTVAYNFNTNEQLRELEQFRVDIAPSLGGATGGIDEAIARTGRNIAWMDKNYDVILQWLTNNRKH